MGRRKRITPAIGDLIRFAHLGPCIYLGHGPICGHGILFNDRDRLYVWSAVSIDHIVLLSSVESAHDAFGCTMFAHSTCACIDVDHGTSHASDEGYTIAASV